MLSWQPMCAQSTSSAVLDLASPRNKASHGLPVIVADASTDGGVVVVIVIVVVDGGDVQEIGRATVGERSCDEEAVEGAEIIVGEQAVVDEEARRESL